jgi:hypothetical protein
VNESKDGFEALFMEALEPYFSLQRHVFNGRKRQNFSLHPAGCFYYSNRLNLSILLFNKISGTVLVFKKYLPVHHSKTNGTSSSFKSSYAGDGGSVRKRTPALAQVQSFAQIGIYLPVSCCVFQVSLFLGIVQSFLRAWLNF